MMAKKKEESSKRRKRKDVDLISDSDDLIADIIAQMRVAAEVIIFSIWCFNRNFWNLIYFCYVILSLWKQQLIVYLVNTIHSLHKGGKKNNFNYSPK